MIAPAPSLSLCWQKPSPLFINLSPLLPFCRRSAPHLGTSVPPTPRFLHASQSVIGYYRRALLSSLSSVVIPKDMCGIAIRRVLCLEWALPEGGIISPAQGHQTHTHTHIEGHARGKCHRGGSHSAGKSFPLSFCLPSLPLYIIEKATQQGTLGGCPSSSWKGGGGTEGWWGEEFPRGACIDRFWLKTHPFHHSFHHQRSDLFFIYFILRGNPLCLDQTLLSLLF